MNKRQAVVILSLLAALAAAFASALERWPDPPALAPLEFEPVPADAGP